ncbi:methyl-CpG-binding domain-containing protein 4-like isoform X2 [Malania oleifera]|uniref:methyl-CpG-binding domain-containing protein 4-like isoform X2 n=1 Tax=Malania oleifera TaxID=397392 RepID=UPI0025AE81C0|nr:methyl-CpG-binding domain-containing protein 4-like isoform X2 [Malania oleifera]
MFSSPKIPIQKIHLPSVLGPENIRSRELQLVLQAGRPRMNTPKSRGIAKKSIDAYAAQCGKCFKWRVIPTQEEYEVIRSKFTKEPFFCNWKPDVSCEDPADVEYDTTRIWVIDKPDIPKTPDGFKRALMLRKDFSKLDAHYDTPDGKKVRGPSEVAAFVQANPEYKDAVPDFCFTVPKLMDETIPGNVKRKGSATSKKRMITSKEDSVQELLGD